MYPQFQGKDLSTKWPGIMYVHGAIGGAVSGPYTDKLVPTQASKMTDQVKGLGSSYPGDVLVTITIGGNDLADHAPDAVLKSDGPDRTQLATNLAAALGELSMPGRLGSGKVYIVEANIYDASDGKGNWKTGGGAACPPYDTGMALDTMTFQNWNDVVTAAIGKTQNDFVLDIHTLFAGHGFNGTDKWYFTDCIHPNSKGHNEIRREVWRMLTGDKIGD
jgi:lysophospholipase L1-like esterase